MKQSSGIHVAGRTTKKKGCEILAATQLSHDDAKRVYQFAFPQKVHPAGNVQHAP